ncbi:Mitochondrial-processing peptidase subunit alpha [Spiromyces aspiralis]|uniref:Mitochondrial-processing peptidase subunit alpha n=1 Tax=Spiromyces aspiralis TaxID=68401 RepID=A0ACC1HJN4_9FUNG|nr:Mitochondrial-processing peptidase subunit alpha [Spiromyces aspiralis]
MSNALAKSRVEQSRAETPTPGYGHIARRRLTTTAAPQLGVTAVRSEIQPQSVPQDPAAAFANARLFPSSPTTQTLNNGYTHITTLPNGLRVTSENNPGHFSAIGVYVDAGSRYETDRTSGFAHIMDRLSFKSTHRYSADEMLSKIESLGGSIMCSSSRECIMYQAAVFPSDLHEAVELLAETTLRPKFKEEELDMVRMTIPWELQELETKPEMWLPEIIHEAAYGGRSLGRPLLCPPRQLDVVCTNDLREYWRTWYRPERMVVAGIGVEHEEFVKLCTQMGFADLPRSEDPVPSLISANISKDSGISNIDPRPKIYRYNKVSAANPSQFSLATTRAEYHGGKELVAKEGQEFTHIHLGFESAGVDDESRLYTFAALQMLLGGGGSFSAGGPGKGMYSRLYTRVLNQHAWIESCLAFHHCYIDTGLLGVSGSCQPKAEHALLDVMANELEALTHGPNSSRLLRSLRRPFRSHSADSTAGLDDEEVARAKNQLKSNLLMNLESRMVQLEDLGRQVQTTGAKVPVETMIEKIDSVTIDRLRKAASELVGRPATLVAQGEVGGLETYADAVLASHGISIGKRA